MTWNTSDGDRHLIGAEAALLRDTLAVMVDHIAENINYEGRANWPFEVHLFDELTPTQQLSLLRQVATHLLTETADTPDLTAVNEAAVYAIYRTLAAHIEIEIDSEDDHHSDGDPKWIYHWRTKALAAHDEAYPFATEEDPIESDDWSVPTVECTVLSRWDFLVECLADRILWDRDFEMAGSFLDVEPAKAAALKQILGIKDDYYTDVASELRSDQVEEMLNSIRELTQQKPR